jgi:hypothetical protein
VRARIKRHAFIGITAAAAPGRERGHSSGKQGALKSLKHLLPSCMSPGQQQQPSPTGPHPRYPAKHPGGPHLVSPTPEPSAASSTSTGGAWMAGTAAADLQPEAAAAVSSSSMSWQQQLHYQDLSPPSPATAAVGGLGSPQSASAAGRRASSGAAGPASPLPVRSPRKSSHTPPPEAVLSSTPETPSGWASGSHSLRHWPTWHAGHTSGGGPGPAAETELSTTAVAAAAAASTSSGGGGGGAGGSGSPRGSSGSSGGWLEGEGGREGRGVWKILWRGGSMQQQLSFEATHTT